MTGQDGHARGTAAVTSVAVLVAGTLLSAVGVAALQSDTASASTVLARAAGAELVLPDGTRRAAVEGETVPNGATVELPGPGSAVLVVRDRETYLAQDSAVQVVDGASQRLTAGTAFVDAADAPGLSLETGSGSVTVREGALVRVEDGLLPRVGVLRVDDGGTGAEVRATGRRTAAEVPAYFQVQVPRGGLPGSVVPLRLAEDDRYERQLAEDLVETDRYLNATGDALVGSPEQGGVLRTALTSAAPDVPADREGGLAYLVAAAAADAPTDRLSEVRDLRAQGGSWGVVAAIVGASSGEVAAALDALLAPTAVALPQARVEDLDMSEVLGLGEPAPAGAPDPDPAGGDGNGSGGTPPPPSRPRPSSPPTSPPPSDPTLVGTVTDVVDTVLDIIVPSPSAAPVPVKAPVTTPSPTPVPLLQLDLPLLD